MRFARFSLSMIKIDLITGFLGSGKTTFIRQYAMQLISQGQRIAILENDYGAINIDMMLLKDLEGPNCDLEMVVGGNDYDCHKHRFKSKLIALGMLGYDRVLIEPSGIYDVDEFFDVLHEEPLDRWYEIGSVLAVVDSNLEETLSHESDYLLVSQTADAGMLIFSKADLASEADLHRTVAHLNRAMEQFRSDRRFDLTQNILLRDAGPLSAEDTQLLMNAGSCLSDHIKLPLSDMSGYESLFYMNVTPPSDDLKERVRALFQDPDAGDIFRIKGYLKTMDGEWVELNATKQSITLNRAPEGQEVIIVIGEHLSQAVIASYWEYEYGTGKQLLDQQQ